MLRPALTLWCFAAVLSVLPAQSPEPLTGDAGAAEKYLDWARRAMDEGRWAEAEAALERGADFSSVSSDLSYLLALVRSHQNRPPRRALEALRRALTVDRWSRYSPGDARLCEAALLIRLRAYSEALGALALADEGVEAACLRLLCLKGRGDMPAFRRSMARCLDRFPRESRPVRILLEYLGAKQKAGILPEENEQALLNTALGRLPLLLETDPALAYVGAPLIRDAADARRLVAAYRGAFDPDPASIPAALLVGLIDEGRAAAELFAPAPGRAPEERSLDRALIREVWALLRNQAGRELFQEQLLSFSGVISEDTEPDGYAETRTLYRDGLIREYRYDADQDGYEDLVVSFSAGVPVRGEAPVLAGGSAPGAGGSGAEEPPRALVFWEPYPAVGRTEWGGVSYIPRPGEFFFRPLVFQEFLSEGTASFLYPQREDEAGISPRALGAFAVTIQRPGFEFPGALELVELDRGIPRRATEYVAGRPAAVTEFAAGRPLVQRIDLDLDGRLETIRRFRRDSPPLEEGSFPAGLAAYTRIPESSESDWDGDGEYETGEEYDPRGGLIRGWDRDETGKKRFYRSGGEGGR
jgi:tetratricopeptide (TPR) repeat protein